MYLFVLYDFIGAVLYVIDLVGPFGFVAQDVLLILILIIPRTPFSIIVT